MTISRRRTAPGGTDVYGDPIPGTVTTTELVGAFIAPRTSNDIDGPGRAGVIVGLTLFTPYGTDLTSADEIVVSGEGANDGTYRIDGQPGDWKNPWSQWEAGQSTALVRAEG